MSCEDIKRNGNRNKKVFVCTRHCCFVVGSSINEFLFEIFQLDDHILGS